MSTVTRYYIYGGDVHSLELHETERQYRLQDHRFVRMILPKPCPDLFEDEQEAINELISRSRRDIEKMMR